MPTWENISPPAAPGEFTYRYQLGQRVIYRHRPEFTGEILELSDTRALIQWYVDGARHGTPGHNSFSDLLPGEENEAQGDLDLGQTDLRCDEEHLAVCRVTRNHAGYSFEAHAPKIEALISQIADGRVLNRNDYPVIWGSALYRVGSFPDGLSLSRFDLYDYRLAWDMGTGYRINTTFAFVRGIKDGIKAQINYPVSLDQIQVFANLLPRAMRELYRAFTELHTATIRVRTEVSA